MEKNERKRIKNRNKMRTYIITEKDINEIKNQPILADDVVIDDILENLNELPTPKKLDEVKTEFAKFIEDNGFVKPEQPYYVRKGEVFDYGDLRQLFLESRKSGQYETRGLNNKTEKNESNKIQIKR